MDKNGTCPCMDPNALPRRIFVDGAAIGILGLTEIIEQVRRLEITDDKQVAEELVERVKKRNWVPDEAQEKYARALLSEYKKSIPGNKTT